MTATKRVPAEVFPPGEYVRDELDERGWTQSEFADILGVSESSVSDLVAGKRALTPEMAKALEAALGPSAEFWLNLDAYYRLHTTPEAPPSINQKARLYERYPVREMVRRGWVESSENPEVLESRVLDFFDVSEINEKPRFRHAARKGMSGSLDDDLTSVQMAWLFRVKQVAEAMHIPRYSDDKLSKAFETLEMMMGDPEELRHVPVILEEAGIRLVVVEPFPGSKIDGVCFWLDHWRPVIGLSLRLDRIDNLWFVLRHELEHVLRRDAALDSDMESEPDDLPEQEREANRAAANFCVPREELEDFVLRVGPYFSERRILGFSHRLERHPGIVVGQLQHRTERWSLLRKHQVKIREHLVPFAMTDGYGRTCPV